MGSGSGNRGVRSWGGQQLIRNQGQVFIGPGRDWDLLSWCYEVGKGEGKKVLLLSLVISLPISCLSSAALLPDHLSQLIRSALTWESEDQLLTLEKSITDR